MIGPCAPLVSRHDLPARIRSLSVLAARRVRSGVDPEQAVADALTRLADDMRPPQIELEAALEQHPAWEVVLRYMERGRPMRVAEVAQRMGRTQASLWSVVRRMTEAGILERVRPGVVLALVAVDRPQGGR